MDGPLISACGPFRLISRQFASADVIDLTNCIILPGLVNAHTHLELSHLKDKVPFQGDFVDWVARLTSMRLPADSGGASHSDPLRDVITRACTQSLMSGVTTVGDISYRHRARPILARLGIRKTSFAEVFGMTSDLTAQRGYLLDCVSHTSPGDLLRPGLSPHAPYSAGPDLYKMTADLAATQSACQDNQIALTTHLAETPEEIEFITKGTGPWLDYLKKINRWDNSFSCPFQSPVEYFLGLDLAGQTFLLAHVNYITDDELDSLAGTNHSVVFCPGSHHFFGHPPHRFREMCEAGINLCLGTDSLASNHGLGILDEMRFLHRQYPDFPVETVIKMGTVNGTTALGWRDRVGPLTAGLEADLIAVPLTDLDYDPLADILQSSAQPCLTIVRGNIVYPSGMI